MRRIEVAAPREERLDVVLAEVVEELSRARAAQLVRDGQVTVDGRVATRPGAKVREHAVIVVQIPPPTPTSAAAQDLPLRLVYEDEHLAVVDKVAGMVVHPSAGHADGTLINALLHHLDGLSSVGGEERPGLVHRLDRGTSGLLVVAKTDEAHRSLAAQFAAHTAGRLYLAFVHRPPAADRGTVANELGRHPRDRLRYTAVAEGRGKRAVTHWEVLARRGTVGLVRCALETGRTHQVRVHLSESGSPIVGDGLYGGRFPLPASLRGLVSPSGERPMLHAWRLTFEHPRVGRLSFVAAPPEDFARVAERLEVDLEQAVSH